MNTLLRGHSRREAYALTLPKRRGWYGISNAREGISIGQAGNISSLRCSIVFRMPGSALMRKEPGGFVFEVCDESRWGGRQDRLVLEYEPACNRQSSGAH